MKISSKKKAHFQKMIWDFYGANKRDSLLWRKKITPYKVWVSEVMLQQTQVDRVKGFFDAWMEAFPDIDDLANAPQIEVLKMWKGLGYNSRALRLKRAAEVIVNEYGGKFPKKYDEMLELPGIGPYTAGAICAFAYDEKVVMIETNIRRVFIHHFFNTTSSRLRTLCVASLITEADSQLVHDHDILELIESTLPENNFREWYWALMDYGSYLGRQLKSGGKRFNPNTKSRHYTKQSKFEGSDRQIRSKILEIVMGKKKMSIDDLSKRLKELSDDPERIERIISTMERDGFLSITKGTVIIR